MKKHTIDGKNFQFIDDEVYGPGVMGPDALFMPEGSKLPQLYSPRVMHALESRSIFNILKTWALIGRAKEFSLDLIARDKKVYNMLERFPMINEEEKLLEKDRYGQMQPVDAIFLECKSFCRHRKGVTVQTTKKVLSFIHDLAEKKRIGIRGRKVYFAAVTGLSQQTSRPHGKYRMEVAEVFTSPRGEIHHRLKPGERS